MDHPTDANYAYHYRDLMEHLHHVHRFIGMMQVELLQRLVTHDRSKLGEIENDTYAAVTPRLKGLTYGTDEYRKNLKDLGPAVKNHYQNNRHHPEFFDNGINDMNLIDLVEMLCDWAAAVKRHDDGDMNKSLEINRERFGMSDQLVQILKNTIPLFDRQTLSSDDTQIHL